MSVLDVPPSFLSRHSHLLHFDALQPGRRRGLLSSSRILRRRHSAMAPRVDGISLLIVVLRRSLLYIECTLYLLIFF